MATLTITKIHCTTTTTGLGDDELYYQISLDGSSPVRYPSEGEHETSGGENWEVNQSYTFTSSAVVTLWEEDVGADDKIAAHTFSASPASGSVPMNGDGGEFALYYTVTA